MLQGASRRDLLGRLHDLELPPQVKAVGLTRQGSRAAFFVVTDASGSVTAQARAAATDLLPDLQDVPVVTRDVPGRLRAAAYLPRAQAEALTPEQESSTPSCSAHSSRTGAPTCV